MRFSGVLLLIGIGLSCHWAPARAADEATGARTFDQALWSTIHAFNAKDSAAINRLVHPQIGVFVLYRIGIPVATARMDRLYLDSKNDAGDLPGFVATQFHRQQLDATPRRRRGNITEEDLCNISALRPGLYIDARKPARDLADNWLLFAKSIGYEAETMIQIERSIAVMNRFNDSSRHVTLITAMEDGQHVYGEAFVFYLSKIDGAWYLTVVDYATPDCSA